MNYLILSCSTGEGHNSAAHSIYEELLKRKEKVFIKDVLSFANKEAEKIIKSFFNGVAVNTPQVFGIMYKAGAFISNSKVKSPIYLANTMYADKLNKYIISKDIDIIICTHLFPMEALTYLKKNKNLKVKCYAILTDYTSIPFIEETSMNGYFIPHKDLEYEFTSKKIPNDKIFSCGIPVSEKFYKKYGKKDARKILNLPINKKIILIMGGGVGCGNIIEMSQELLCKTDNDTLILVLVGKNKKLEKDINKKFNNEKVKAIGFTKRVEIYMDASDIFLSKPGGLSSTEAAVKEIPLIHTMPIPGCETKNSYFFSKKEMSIEAKDIDSIVSNTIKVLKSPKIQEKLMKNQNKYINKKASIDIINTINSL